MKPANAGEEPFDLRELEHEHTGVPKYLQLLNALAAAISDGRWKAGARFPTEERLTEATGLSIGTVQKSLKSLSDAGWWCAATPPRARGSGRATSPGAR